MAFNAAILLLSLLSASSAAVLPCSSSTSVVTAPTSAPGAVSNASPIVVPLVRQPAFYSRTPSFPAPVTNGTVRRSTQAGAMQLDVKTLYFMEVQIGDFKRATKDQLKRYSLQVDTGSSDIWITNDPDTQCGRSTNLPAVQSGKSPKYGDLIVPSDRQENPSVKPWVAVPTEAFKFEAEYCDNTVIVGDYYKSSFGLDDWCAENIVFGRPNSDSCDPGQNPHDPINTCKGMLGLGFHSSQHNHEYTGLLHRLKEQKNITSEAFSIGYKNTGAGEIIFGGYDSSFESKLQTVCLEPTDPAGVTEFVVNLSGILLSQNTGRGKTIISGQPPRFSKPVEARLDTGSPFIRLPEEAARPILNQLGARPTSDGLLSVHCSSNEDVSLEFQLGASTISIPVQELHYQTPQSDVCNLAIHVMSEEEMHNEQGIATLGDFFLRNAYVVFDAPYKAVHIAQNDYWESQDLSSQVRTLSDDGTMQPPSWRKNCNRRTDN